MKSFCRCCTGSRCCTGTVFTKRVPPYRAG